MDSLKERIRAKAGELGFCKTGFTTMDDLPRVAEEGYRRGEPQFYQDFFEAGSRPRELYPQGKSIIVLAYDYSRCAFPEKLLPHVARTYLSRSYLPVRDLGLPMRDRLDAFEAFLAGCGIDFQDDGNKLMMRPTALRAGVITFGRNNFAYVDGVGSFILLYGYMVDVELEPDEPSGECPCPPGCHACVDACPTGALRGPFDLQLTKCMLFDNCFRHARLEEKLIPEENRARLGQHVHGCDVCQEVCPRNRRALTAENEPDPVLEHIAQGFELAKLLHMPDGYYEEYVRPIMYNYVRDVHVFQRNAAIAMANSGDARYLPDLEAERDNPSELMHPYVEWAIEQLEGCAAR